MQTYELKLGDFLTLLARDLDNALASLRTQRCSACETPLEAEPIQVLADWRDWHAGWQSLVCPRCSHSETRFTLVTDGQPLVYQTHPVC